MESYISKRKLIFALISNFIIIVLEIIGVVLSIKRHSIYVFLFYTENTNYLALVISIIYCIGCLIALKNNTNIAKWIHILRYMVTMCLTLTFVIVICILIPFKPNFWLFMLFQDSNLYQHLLCPVISVISFLFFESQIKLNKKHIFYSLIPTIIYGVIFLVLNILKIIEGPYPFFYVYSMAWYSALLSLLGVATICFCIALLLYWIHNKIFKNAKISTNYA